MGDRVLSLGRNEKREMSSPFLIQPQFIDLGVVGFSVYTVFPEEVEELAYCIGL